MRPGASGNLIWIGGSTRFLGFDVIRKNKDLRRLMKYAEPFRLSNVASGYPEARQTKLTQFKIKAAIKVKLLEQPTEKPSLRHKALFREREAKGEMFFPAPLGGPIVVDPGEEGVEFLGYVLPVLGPS